jgi:hypothetical protein
MGMCQTIDFVDFAESMMPFDTVINQLLTRADQEELSGL